jgi:hypothetical protein
VTPDFNCSDPCPRDYQYVGPGLRVYSYERRQRCKFSEQLRVLYELGLVEAVSWSRASDWLTHSLMHTFIPARLSCNVLLWLNSHEEVMNRCVALADGFVNLRTH